MDRSVEIAIEKIKQLQIENKKLWADRKKLLVEMKVKLPIKIGELLEKKRELINDFDSNSKARQESYLDVILHCYNRWLEDEKNEGLASIFNKCKPFIQCQTINMNPIAGRSQFHNEEFHKLKLNNLLTSFKEGFDLKKGIKILKKKSMNMKIQLMISKELKT